MSKENVEIVGRIYEGWSRAWSAATPMPRSIPGLAIVYELNAGRVIRMCNYT